MDPRITEGRIREILDRNWGILTPQAAMEYEIQRLKKQDELKAILEREGIPQDESGDPKRATDYAMNVLNETMAALGECFSPSIDCSAGIRASMRNPSLLREIRLIIPPAPDFHITQYLYWEDLVQGQQEVEVNPSIPELKAWVAWVKGGDFPHGDEEG